jgi:ATP-binding cassette subfamily B (MDR/TAP) protein 1
MEKDFKNENVYEQLLNKSKKNNSQVHQKELKIDTVKPDGKKAVSFFQLQYALSKKFDIFLVFLGLIGSIGTGLSMPIFSIIFGGTVNDFGPSAQTDKEKFLNTIEKMCLKFIFVGLGIWFCSFLNIWLWTYNGKTITKRLKKKYFSLLMSQEQGYFDVQDPNEFATKVQSQIKIIEQGVNCF